MEISEIIERNFSINENGLVMDDAGNEWRGEDGQVVFIKGKEKIPNLFDEFMGLINDDPDFNYDENEFVEWLNDYDLV